MNWWEAVVLGLVQGFTEFLPVSSSGHLVITERLFGIESQGVTIEVLLHVATLLAVVIVYRARLIALARGVFTADKSALRFIALLAIATIPAGVVGLTLDDYVESAFGSLLTVGVSLIATGLVLLSTRAIKVSDPSRVDTRASVLMGLAQAVAILPGVSRSGSTIATGLWLRVSPVEAAEFSFIMAIPTIAGAAVLQLPDLGAGVVIDGVPLAIAFVAALVSGVVAIRFLVRLLSRGSFHAFAPYCLLVGGAVLVWSIVG